MTESEQVFERYLEGQNLVWTRFPTAKGRHPDYKVEHGHSTCLFEVKEFGDPAIKPTGGFSACPAIREKISQARKTRVQTTRVWKTKMQETRFRACLSHPVRRQSTKG